MGPIPTFRSMMEKVRIKKDYYEGFWLWKKFIVEKGHKAKVIIDSNYWNGICTVLLIPEETFITIPKDYLKEF